MTAFLQFVWSLSRLVQAGSVSAGITLTPTLFQASAEMVDWIPQSLYQTIVHLTLGPLSRTQFLIFCRMDRLSFSKSSCSGSFLLHTSLFIFLLSLFSESSKEISGHTFDTSLRNVLS